jgi:hypothetical protein
MGCHSLIPFWILDFGFWIFVIRAGLFTIVLQLAPFEDAVAIAAIVLGNQQELPEEGHKFGLHRAAKGAGRPVRHIRWFEVNKRFEFCHSHSHYNFMAWPRYGLRFLTFIT